MAFELDIKTPLAQDLPRLLREQMANAEHALRDMQGAQAIHDARRHLKRARAMLRLLDDELRGPAAATDDALRAAGRHLSASRDATVLGATIDWLIDLRPPRATATALRAWRKTLRAGTDSTIAPEALTAARDVLQRARRTATAILPDHDAIAAWAGFEASYRAGRRALRRAQAKPTATRLHDLRKALKHHVYQLRVLRPLWPAVLGAVHAESDHAAELLGLHHDCEVLREQLAGSGLAASRQARIDALAADRQAILAGAALVRCQLLYTEPAGDYAHRITAYWRHPAPDESING